MFKIRKLALATAIGAALIAPAAPALAQTTLTFSTWVPPTHHLSVWQRNWASDLEKATAGRIKVQELPKALRVLLVTDEEANRLAKQHGGVSLS